MSDLEYLRCPLPALRMDRSLHDEWSLRYEDARTRLDASELRWWLARNPEVEPNPAVMVCGERLFVDGRTSADLMVDDLNASTDPLDLDHYGVAWRVTCAVGHVLFVPDDEGNDDLARLAITAARLTAAVALVAAVEGSEGT